MERRSIKKLSAEEGLVPSISAPFSFLSNVIEGAGRSKFVLLGGRVYFCDLPVLYKNNGSRECRITLETSCGTPTQYFVCKTMTDARYGDKKRYLTHVKGCASKHISLSAVEAMEREWYDLQKSDGWVENKDEDATRYPMKLSRWDKISDAKKEGVHIVTPKLNGVHGVVKNGKVYSQNYTEYSLPHIEKALKEQDVPEGVEGEIWAHGFSLEEIVSMISSGDKRLGLYIFDEMDGPPSYIMRLGDLVKMSLEEPLFLIPYTICESREQVERLYESYLADGLEGAVARKPNDVYYANKRSTTSFKIKPVISEEFKIVQIVSDYDPMSRSEMIAYICECKGGTFKATPADTKKWRADEYKKEYLNRFPSVGKPLTVEYREMTSKGIPRHAVAIVRRVYE